MSTEIWFYEKGFYKCYVEDSEQKNKLASWKSAKDSCFYSYPDGTVAWDFIFPTKLYNRVAKLVGFTKKRADLHKDKNEL